MRSAAVDVDAARLADSVGDGVVVHREDGRNPDQLRELAQAVRGRGARIVVVAGSPDGAKMALAVASGDNAVDAGALVRELAPLA